MKLFLVVLIVIPAGGLCGKNSEPYGRLIGNLQNYAHNIKGTVYAVDEHTVFIKGFTYDGMGPDTYFWVGSTYRPGPEGHIVPYPEMYNTRDPPVLRNFTNEDVLLRLPYDKKIRDIQWLAVWCRRFTANFGDVKIPPMLRVPQARILPEFKRLAHGLRSDNISILDARTIYIPNLHYDGAGPDAYFWVGNGTEPNLRGVKVPNEMNSLEPLKGYQGADIEIQLRDGLTVYDIDWLAVWCVQYHHNFGHVMIPKDLDVPPALGQTKISTTASPRPPQQPSNCVEFLDGRMQVRWIILQDDHIQITVSGQIKDGEYMAFGVSGDPYEPKMVGGDITVMFYDTASLSFRAVDYYMSHQSQCDGHSGVCPDDRIGGRNDVILVSGDRTNGITTVTFRKPLQTNEAVYDRPISLHEPVSVIAAFGRLNSRKEANAHLFNDKTMLYNEVNFGGFNTDSCSSNVIDLPIEVGGLNHWPPASIIGETHFVARIGPTGGKRGYTPITGHPSWGIAWYINDLLIPEITVERGQTYTFVVEGGQNSVNPAKFHPFYITDSAEGGFGQGPSMGQKSEHIYAGVEYDSEDYPYPTAIGRYCEWVHKSVDQSADSETFSQFFHTLRLECERGEPGILNWTVPIDAPDLLYYQCYTHKNLGWKLHVVDPGYISRRNGRGNGVPSIQSSLRLLLNEITVLLFFFRYFY